jgi:hypothetical protein
MAAKARQVSGQEHDRGIVCPLASSRRSDDYASSFSAGSILPPRTMPLIVFVNMASPSDEFYAFASCSWIK